MAGQAGWLQSTVIVMAAERCIQGAGFEVRKILWNGRLSVCVGVICGYSTWKAVDWRTKYCRLYEDTVLLWGRLQHLMPFLFQRRACASWQFCVYGWWCLKCLLARQLIPFHKTSGPRCFATEPVYLFSPGILGPPWKTKGGRAKGEY